MAIASGLPRPAVYIVPDRDPNAFATGRDPEHAAIAVTEGLLETLNREQLQGVVAHEMSHIRNFDIRLMTIVAALVGAVALLADWSARGWRYGAFGGSARSSRSSRGKNEGGSAGGVAAAARVAAGDGAGADRGAAAGDDGVAAARVPRRRVSGGADPQSRRARRLRWRRSRAGSSRRRRFIRAARSCASPIRSAARSTKGTGAGRTCSRRIRRCTSGSPPCARWPSSDARSSDAWTRGFGTGHRYRIPFSECASSTRASTRHRPTCRPSRRRTCCGRGPCASAASGTSVRRAGVRAGSFR